MGALLHPSSIGSGANTKAQTLTAHTFTALSPHWVTTIHLGST